MTNEDLSKLDFPLATLKMLETNTALLQTILENQKTIMAALNIGNQAEINEEVWRRMNHFMANVQHDLKNNVPETNYIKYPKN
jgi:hypothetical protein